MKSTIKFKSAWVIALMGIALFACKEDFLRVNPVGALDENVLTTVGGAETLLIGAYSNIDGTSAAVTGWEGAGSNWVFGSIAGGDANKGSDAGDQPAINPIQSYNADAANPYFNAKWRILYDGISRANATLRVLPNIPDGDPNVINRIRGEATALRGHYHFEARRVFGRVPYLDEETTDFYVPNDREIWPDIEADLRFAYDNLPETMGEVGRINKWVAGAMLAKALMYQQKWTEAKPIVEAIIANGRKPNGVAFAMLPNYGDAFDADFGNAAESVFAWQYSVNDGSQGWNAGYGEVLNFTHGASAPVGCCGFHQPTHEFVNSFRVGADGLPLLDGSYNLPANQVRNDDGLASTDPFTPDAGLLDPRIDHTMGRRGIPYLDWGIHVGRSWVRDQNYAGPFSPKKNGIRSDQVGTLTEVGNWTSGWTANNYQYIRFAEVLLWAAEIEIEVGSLDNARNYINQVRDRAKTGEWVTLPNGTPAANYRIEPYPAGHSAFSSQANARVAMRMERKLELGMEGHLFFDLVRWGIATETINAFITFESAIRTQLYAGPNFNANKEVYPIPLIQLDISRGTLTQNPGY
ncbi:RagB/SusD family nutrient uptake outer membrane protein [Pararhodonellum marinum]|uniref:RagB/SusD family nutrient uptake outer membrane protein n=1 Tax=Pararhodonellum marinum TaxID=2755358 RepID=UPI00188E6D87|nr:RagB/SusD family nutrient uptake outer membrane protein [Pararhodonellum marinum]